MFAVVRVKMQADATDFERKIILIETIDRSNELIWEQLTR